MDTFKRVAVVVGLLLIVAAPIYINNSKKVVEIPELGVGDEVVIYRSLGSDEAYVATRFYASSDLVNYVNVVIDLNKDGYVKASLDNENEWLVRNISADSVYGDSVELPIKLSPSIKDEDLVGTETAFTYSGVELSEDIITYKADNPNAPYASEQRKVSRVEYR